MGLVLLAAGVAMVVWGVLLGKKHIAEHHAIERYKFEHRTSGGAVQFPDYDASVDFRKREMRQGMRGKVLVAGLVIGVFCILAAFLAFRG